MLFEANLNLSRLSPSRKWEIGVHAVLCKKRSDLLIHCFLFEAFLWNHKNVFLVQMLLKVKRGPVCDFQVTLINSFFWEIATWVLVAIAKFHHWIKEGLICLSLLLLEFVLLFLALLPLVWLFRFRNHNIKISRGFWNLIFLMKLAGGAGLVGLSVHKSWFCWKFVSPLILLFLFFHGCNQLCDVVTMFGACHLLKIIKVDKNLYIEY